MLDKLSQSIHDRWAADAVLTTALPATRVTTGRSHAAEPDMPYAVFELSGGTNGSTDLRTNDDARVETVAARLKIHVGPQPVEYAAGCSIAQAARACYERADFDLSDDAGRVIDVLTDSLAVVQAEDDGCWTFTLDFRFKVYRR